MPNHVSSVCKVSGPNIEVDRFIETCIKTNESGKKCFDFNTIIPMPESVKSAPSKSPLSKEEAERCRLAMKETGFPSWYEWSINNWGTKWNAYQFKERGNLGVRYTFEFQTAWAFPEPVFIQLTNMFPELVFEVVCFDEGMGFAGKGRFTKDMFRCSKDLVTPELYKEVYGEDWPTDDDE